jgi:hypothetical protein
LRVKVAETDKYVSERVNQAVKLYLAEDAEDLAAFERSVSTNPTCPLRTS